MTIKDVAKKAKVSVATVSRVLNNPECVKQETKDRVLEVILQLNYTPNLLGRNLRRLETKKIMVVLDNISNQFYSNVVKGIEDKAKENNFTVMICTMRSSKENFFKAMEMLSNKVVDGALVLCGDLGSGKLKQMAKQYPIVCVCEIVKGVTSVSVDDYQAGYDATNYLISLGKKDIAIVCDIVDIDKKTSFGYRLKGYKDALEKNGIKLDEKLVVGKYGTETFTKDAVNRLLKMDKLPDAVFCLSDTDAIHVIKELSINGIKVPEDVSVMGFDDTLMSKMYIPSITTVSQPQYDIGYKATEILLEKMADKEKLSNQTEVFLEHKIVSRKSVKS